MSDLRDLYQEVILDHSKKPRNFRKLESADQTVRGYNPLCGDHLTLYVKMNGDAITDISFEGSGCAISKASASMMTEAVKGKSKSEAKALFEKFHRMLTGAPGQKLGTTEIGKLAVFSGVCEFPVRVKCATLSWHTLKNALDAKGETVTTE